MLTLATVILLALGQAPADQGCYDAQQLACAKRHPRMAEFCRNVEARTNGTPADLVMAVHRAAACHFLRYGDYDAFAKQCAAKLAEQWPCGFTAHQLTSGQPNPVLIRLAEAVSLMPELGPVLKKPLLDSLEDIYTGRLVGTSIGRTLDCRVSIQLAYGLKCDPFSDYGVDWGWKRISSEIEPCGWANWSVGSIWYQVFTTHSALIHALWRFRDDMDVASRAKFDALYTFPIRVTCKGRTPVIGEDVVRSQPYAFFGGFVEQWRGNDAASVWARYEIGKRGDPLTFNSLTVGHVRGQPDYPEIATGNRKFGERMEIVEGEKSCIVRHYSDGRKIAGGHTSPRLPEIFKIELVATDGLGPVTRQRSYP